MVLRSSTARPEIDSRLIGSTAVAAASSGDSPLDATCRSTLPSVKWIDAADAPQRFTARSAIASSTGWTSVGELEMARRISLIAVCCSRPSLVSLNSRTLSMAMAAWRANVWTSATCLSENRSGFHPPQGDGADRVVLAHQRHRQQRVMPKPSLHFAPARILVLGLQREVLQVDGRPVDDGPARDQPAADRKYIAYGGGRVADPARHPAHVLALDQRDDRLRGVAELQRALGNGIQHRLHVGRRCRYHAQDFADGGLLLEALLGLVEQPHIVDGDRGLARKRLHERDLVRRKQSRFAPIEEDGAIRASFTDQRNGEHRTTPEALHVVPCAGEFGVHKRDHVLDVNRLAIDGGATRDGRPVEWHG